MAIITEEPEPEQPKQIPKPPKPKTHSSPSPPNNNPFSFWFYFTLSLSLLSVLFVFTLYPEDPKAWFLALPGPLRHHYSNGRTIKVQTHPNQPPLQVFTLQEGPTSSEYILIVHAQSLNSYSYRHLSKSLAANGLHVISVDLPGHGFSDKSVHVSVEGANGVLGRLRYVYSEIQERGLFWAFDQMVETGQVPYEEIQARMSNRKIRKAIDLGPQDIGKVLGEVIESMGLAPVHLILHDSALGLSANFVSERAELVRSVTFVDTASSAAGAFPLWTLEVPLLREIVLGVPFVFAKVVSLCCSKRSSDSEVVRVLLKGRDGRRAVVNVGKRVNSTFDLAEWAEGLKGMPMQVIWSAGWSEEWSREGDRVAAALPQATFLTHSGGRWAQEDAAAEVAEKISQFVLSLPKSIRKVEQESVPEHIQKMLDEAKSSGHDHHHTHDHGHGHDHLSDGHIHEPNYMDAYGLGHGHHGW